MKYDLKTDDVIFAKLISRFASNIVDITTDYSKPVLRHFDFKEFEIDIINKNFRPEIEFYENEFFGIVKNDLDKLIIKTLSELKECAGRPAHFMKFMCELSDGRDRWIWMPARGWSDLGRICFHDKIHYQPAQISQKDFTKLKHIYNETIVEHQLIVERCENELPDYWDKGNRTPWDQTVYNLIFKPLNAATVLSSLLLYKAVRKLSESIVRTFDAHTCEMIDDEMKSVLTSAGEPGRSEHFLPVYEIVSLSRQEWLPIEKALKIYKMED